VQKMLLKRCQIVSIKMSCSI